MSSFFGHTGRLQFVDDIATVVPPIGSPEVEAGLYDFRTVNFENVDKETIIQRLKELEREKLHLEHQLGIKLGPLQKRATAEQNNQFELSVEPKRFDGVNSNQCYKITLKNEDLHGKILHFGNISNVEVLSFSDLKRRPLTKEAWPVEYVDLASIPAPKRSQVFEVKAKLLTDRDEEIEECDKCPSWKEKTSKPLILLTPNGNSFVEYDGEQCLLVIFRCCPRYHKCSFLQLELSLSSPTMEMSTTIGIFKKKKKSGKRDTAVDIEKEPKKKRAKTELVPSSVVPPVDSPLKEEQSKQLSLELLSPNQGPADLEVRVKLIGSGFHTNCVVFWDGSPVETWFTSETELWCFSPRGNPGQSVPVCVAERSSGGFLCTENLTYTYNFVDDNLQAWLIQLGSDLEDVTKQVTSQEQQIQTLEQNMTLEGAEAFLLNYKNSVGDCKQKLESIRKDLESICKASRTKDSEESSESDLDQRSSGEYGSFISDPSPQPKAAKISRAVTNLSAFLSKRRLLGMDVNLGSLVAEQMGCNVPIKQEPTEEREEEMWEPMYEEKEDRELEEVKPHDEVATYFEMDEKKESEMFWNAKDLERLIEEARTNGDESLRSAALHKLANQAFPTEMVADLRRKLLECGLLEALVSLANISQLHVVREITELDIQWGNPIGESSTCKVYEGKFQSREVVVKVYESTNLSFSAERFKRDLLVNCLLEGVSYDPPVPRSFACSKLDSNNVFVVRELMGKGSLHTLLKQLSTCVDFFLTLKLAHAISASLKVLHSYNVVHRDIQSRNLLVTEDYRVKISNFGLARSLSCEADFTKDPIEVSAWVAPEVLEKNTYYKQSDVYSFGIVLWELLSGGTAPFGDVKVWALPQMVMSGARPPIPGKASKEFVEIMCRCWDSDPEKRPTFETLERQLNELFLAKTMQGEATEKVVVDIGPSTASPERTSVHSDGPTKDVIGPSATDHSSSIDVNEEGIGKNSWDQLIDMKYLDDTFGGPVLKQAAQRVSSATDQDLDISSHDLDFISNSAVEKKRAATI